MPIALYLMGVGVDRITGRLASRERVRERSRECAELLTQLGPAFIKAGQALSTRPDIIPPTLLEELAALQDQLPGFDSALAMACIEEDLGAPGGGDLRAAGARADLRRLPRPGAPGGDQRGASGWR